MILINKTPYKKTHLLFLFCILLTALLYACGKKEPASPASGASAECGSVSIASMNWQSAQLLAEIDRLILENGYGCEVTVIAGDTIPTLTSMAEKGTPDIAPESWLNAMRETLDTAVDEGKLHYAASTFQDGGIEGWWIPKYIADTYPDIQAIDDVLRYPQLFPASDDKTKGAVHNCPAGWACQITTANAFKAWDAAEKGFKLVDTGSSAGLDGSIAKAYERQEGWLGYYWSPTSIIGKYAMVKLDPGVSFDQEAWDNCNVKIDCQDPQKNAWPVSEVYTVITDRFYKNGGPQLEYLNTRNMGNDTVNAILAWMTDNQANGEDAAKYFLQENEDIWSTWVSPEVVQKVKAELN
jgi:glycine betaine/proline transport system substrate-binding protein